MIWALPSAGLFAHTAQALITWPVSASIPNARIEQVAIARSK
jgi:hypothetical protein